MTFSEKIEEWIKEAETRPGSALMILKLVSNRLRELSEQNEALLNENIALRDGTRVDEHQKRIRHLEYQLEMLKRRVGAGAEMPHSPESTIALLVYNAAGRIARLDPVSPAKLEGQIASEGEFPRFLALPPDEEILLLFTSGRVATLPVSDIPPFVPGAAWAWQQAALPDEPHAGERLACIMPLGRVSVSDYFMQVSRRGWVKKTLTTVSQSVLDNAFLGRGAVQKSDQAFDVTLAKKKTRYALITYEGRALTLNVDGLSYAAEERIRLSATDYIVGAFLLETGKNMLCVTQNGKIIQRAADDVEIAKSAASRGQGLISANRLAQGTRFVGAVAAGEADQLVALDAEGQVTVQLAREAAAGGTLRPGAVILAIGVIPAGA